MLKKNNIVKILKQENQFLRDEVKELRYLLQDLNIIK